MSQLFKTIQTFCATHFAPIAALLAITYPWLLSPGYLFFTDFVWGPHARLDPLRTGLGATGVMKLLGLVLPPDAAQKIFIVAALALVVVGGYRLTTSLIGDRRLASVLSFFFLFNPYVYDRLGYGQLYVIASLGLLCLGYAELLRAYLRGGERRSLPLAGLYIGLAIELSPHFLFFAALAVAAWFLALVVRGGVAWRKLLAPVLAACALVAAVNAHWIIGGFFGGHTTTAVAAFREADFNAFRTAGKSGPAAVANVLMFSGFWGMEQHRYYDLTSEFQAWARSFFLLLPLALWGAVAAWRDRQRRPLVMALLVTFALAAFLAVGVRTGLTRAVTLWLADHLPGFAGLRETQKWVAVQVVAFGALLAWGADRLFSRDIVQRNRAVMLGALAVVCVMQAPLMLGGMAGTIRATSYPAAWQAAADRIAAGGCAGPTVFLPWHLYMHFSWAGTITANPARRFFPCETFMSLDPEWHGAADVGDSVNDEIAAVVAGKGSGAGELFAARDVRYILLAKEVDWQEYVWLDALPQAVRVMDSETLILYEIKK